MEIAEVSWAAAELGGADLGDARLKRRLVRVAERLGAQPNASIPVACNGWAETQAAYRLLAVTAGPGRRGGNAAFRDGAVWVAASERVAPPAGTLLDLDSPGGRPRRRTAGFRSEPALGRGLWRSSPPGCKPTRVHLHKGTRSPIGFL